MIPPGHNPSMYPPQPPDDEDEDEEEPGKWRWFFPGKKVPDAETTRAPGRQGGDDEDDEDDQEEDGLQKRLRWFIARKRGERMGITAGLGALMLVLVGAACIAGLMGGSAFLHATAPVPTKTRVPTKTPLPTATPTPTATPSPTPTPTPVPTPTPTPIPTPTPTPTPSPTPTPTPTPVPTPSGCFAQGVVKPDSTSAKLWFKLCSGTADQVTLHYNLHGLRQNTVSMTFNSSTSLWEFTVNPISSGKVLEYSFTYQQNGVSHNTNQFSWTQP
ncbi:MAG: hypothetical protein ABI456_14180 [Ktedonobacteraceae bacterium]|nr:hypothetical protein [Chloroflexota bacterium]